MMRPPSADDATRTNPPGEFHARVLQYDAALAAGVRLPAPLPFLAKEPLANTSPGSQPNTSPQPAASQDGSAENPDAVRLAQAQACLELLYRYRPRAAEPPIRIPCEPSATLAAQEPCDTPLSNESAADPPRLGRFEVLRELGHGGHGVVFLARDPVLRRLVALKVPRPEVLFTPRMKRRFLREGEAAALLNHPHVLTVYEAGELGPMCYLAQAYCPGQTLAQWLTQQAQPIPPKLAARIVLALAEGVEHAHSRGILHRDLKPSNILLEPYTADVTSQPALSRPFDTVPCPFVPKLSDFGLAKILEGDFEHTAAGAVVGTPGYMSPEQAAGETDHLGPPVDVYGLGAVLYELLCRRPPFEGNSQWGILQAVLRDEPAPPRRLRPDIPRDLEAICLRALDKSPEHRYASARLLADELERFLRGEPTHTRPLSVSERALRWARRRPTFAALLLVIAAATLAIVTLLSWSNARLSRSLAIVERERHRAVQAERIAQEKTRESQQHAYQADMRVAGAAWERGQPEQALDLLLRHLPGRDVRDFRGFLWNYLWRQLQLGSTVITTHAGGATAVAMLPGRGGVITGGAGGQIRGFATDGTLRYELPPLDGSTVNQLAVSPDGAWAAAALNSGVILIWNAATGTRLAGERRHTGWSATVAFCPDGSLLASGGEDGLVRLWSLPTGESLGELSGHTETVRALAFDRQGKTLFSSAEDGTLRAWDFERRTPDARLPDGLLENPTGSWARTLALESDNSGLMAGFWNHRLVYYDVRDNKFGRHIRTLEEDANPLCLASGDRSHLAIGRADGAIRLTRFGGRFDQGTTPLRRHSDRIDALAFSHDAPLLASASRDGTVRLWNLDQPLYNAEFWHPSPLRPRLLWRGTHVALATGPDTVDIYTMPAGQRLCTVQAGAPPSADGAISPPTAEPPELLALDLDSQHGIVYVTDATPQLRGFVIPSAERCFQCPLPEASRRLAIAPDGTAAALLGPDRLVCLALPSGERLADFSLPAVPKSLVWLADSQHCAVGCEDGQLRIWHLRSARQVTAFKAHNEAILSLCLATDGNLLISCADDRRIHVWRTRDWSRWATVAPGTLPHEASFLSGNTRLLLHDEWDRLRLFALSSGEELFEFDLANQCTAMCTSPNGNLALAADGYHVRLLDGRPVDLPAALTTAPPSAPAPPAASSSECP